MPKETKADWARARRQTLKRLTALEARHRAESAGERWHPPHEGAAWLDATLKVRVRARSTHPHPHLTLTLTLTLSLAPSPSP